LVYATRLEPLETAFSAFGSATTKSYSNLANGNYTFHVKARDQAGNEDTTPATRAFTVNVTGGVCPNEITVDNLPAGQSDSQRSFTGKWSLSGTTGQFGANSLYSTGTGLDTYMWKSGVFHPSQACTYRVDVWWTQAVNRSTTVPITVSGHTGGATTTNFNERINGGKWNTHGTYTFPSGAQGTVQVTDQNGQAAADAVRFVLVP
jgi:Y_Y_Y domain